MELNFGWEVVIVLIIVASLGLSIASLKNSTDAYEDVQTIREQLEESRAHDAMEPVSTNNTYIYNNTNITITNSNGVGVGTSIPEVQIGDKKQTVSAPTPVVEPMVCDDILTQEEARLIAHIVVGEAEGESEKGKRLVADTILNRVDNEKFPDTVYEVTHQPGQYDCLWNGRLDRCSVTDEIIDLVLEEAANRSNTQVIYFRTGHYSEYGTPILQEGHHYFCGI